ncbi:uncharacterized protein KQ657_001797 [Scheffersomyces spartinae]|uniref:Mtf2-like C-terminal domain-containing protein n=1 Tax=Scheffersomyces spartinae TaxID=45513 RepID=A0A9P7V6Q7_9ASCO|nr:uncharacterized protein KQ657_001797 [Scheffersomyces spartinae]KAG7192398.1 hypothetical protein KQ657_001797 [Scheffersomyces spartinae]
MLLRFNSSTKKEVFDFEDVGFLESIIQEKDRDTKQVEDTSFASILEQQNKLLHEKTRTPELPDDREVTETLNQFLNLTFEVDEPTKSFDELLQEVGNNNSGHQSSMKSEEPESATEIERKSQIIETEAQVFRNVFDMYMKKDKEADVNEHLLKDKTDTFKLVRTSINNILDSNGLISASPLRSFDEMVLSKALSALKPTFQYIQQDLDTKTEIVAFFKNILERFIQLAREAKEDDPVKMEEIYLRSTLARDRDSEELFNKIAETSASTPAHPTLNVATLPLIFNHVLHVLIFKFADGALPITLYNFLQQNLSLHTVMCNQQTFNHILRATWIYRGKTLVQDITTVYLEMINNGFKGDIVTFNIVKQIVIDYYRLKVGQYPGINDESRLPMWSGEDDKHVQRLRRHLGYLSNRLRHT